MIPKILLQTSKHPYPQYLNEMWKERTDNSWKIEWFSDDDIFKFFDDNPLPEFSNIKEVFNSFTDGGHKADLFRYYFLYLNGGFFIDSDAMTQVHLNDLYSDEHDHILVCSNTICNQEYHPYLDSPTIFNGVMGCIPKSKIIYDALVNAYNTEPELLDSKRLYFVHMLYKITELYKNQYNILFLNEQIGGLPPHYTSYSCIVDASNQTVAKHHFSKKVVPKVRLNSKNDLTFFTTFNLDGYKLYGRAWLKTFISLIDKNPYLRAKVYCEGFMPDVRHENIEFVDFTGTVTDHKRWKILYLKHSTHLKYTKEMAIRFSHKAFVIQHMLENNTDGYVAWLDGDCIFKENDYLTFAPDLLSNNFLACQVEVVKDSPVSHVESGILVFDASHADKNIFVETFKKFYSVEHICAMPNDFGDFGSTNYWQDYGPYDGFILHKTLIEIGIDFVNLNTNEATDILVSSSDTTFRHPELNRRFIHNIGTRGKLEYTQQNSELVIDAEFQCNQHQHIQLSQFDVIIPAEYETITAEFRGEFPFVIHFPLKDLAISGELFLNRVCESNISEILVDSMKPNGLFVDIGSNIGWHSIVVQNAGYDVIAFEPLPLNFGLLKQNCEKEGSILHNVDVSENPRLDDILDIETAQRVDVVKIDVQGLETRVIQGGMNFFNSLRKGTTILIEVNMSRPEFDIRFLIRRLINKTTTTYAVCFWHNYQPIPLTQLLAEVNAGGGPAWNHRPCNEFSLVIVK